MVIYQIIFNIARIKDFSTVYFQIFVEGSYEKSVIYWS